jgi:WD40 repeat protein
MMSDMMTNMVGGLSYGTIGRKVTSAAFSFDGRLLATGGYDAKSNIDIGAMMSGAANQKRPKNSKPPQDPADLMKDFKVESVGQVKLWDVSTGQEIATIKGHGKAVTKVAFSRDGKMLATSSNDNSIKLWDVATQRELKTFTGHSAPR